MDQEGNAKYVQYPTIREWCAWCKVLIKDFSEIVTTTFKLSEYVPYESGQFIERIIFLSLKVKPLTFARIFESEAYCNDNIEIPVSMIPLSDDGRNFVFRTCSNECAESAKTAFENEDYAFSLIFE